MNLNRPNNNGMDGEGNPSFNSEHNAFAPVVFADAFDNHGILGSGAFSDVYKACDRSDGKMYAVKRSKKR